MKKELGKLKGPEISSMDATLRAQADQAISAGDFKRAAQIFKQISNKNKDDKELSIALIETLRRAGDNENSLKITNDLLKKHPLDAAILENKGLCLMNMGEFSDASKVFGEVMKADSKRWRTLNGIGILFAMKSMDKEAIAYYRAALAQSENNPTILNNMGLTLAMGRQYNRAEDVFMRAKRHLPTDSQERKNVDLNLALIYAISGKLDEAERTAAPHLSKAALYNNMGFYAYLSKNTELAKGYLNMALTQSPVYYERAWKNLGTVTGERDTGSEDDGGTNLPPIAPQKFDDLSDTLPSFEEKEDVLGSPPPEKPITETKKTLDNPAVSRPLPIQTVQKSATPSPVPALKQEIKPPPATTQEKKPSANPPIVLKESKALVSPVAPVAVKVEKTTSVPEPAKMGAMQFLALPAKITSATAPEKEKSVTPLSPPPVSAPAPVTKNKAYED